MRGGFPNSFVSLLSYQGPSLEDLAQRVLLWCGEDTLALVQARYTLCERKWSRRKRQALHFVAPGTAGDRRSTWRPASKAVGLVGYLLADPAGDVLVKSRGAEKAGGSVVQPPEDWEEANSQAIHTELGDHLLTLVA